MKRTLIFAAYAAIAVADAAIAQSPPERRMDVAAIKPAPIARPSDTVGITYGQGGRIDEHSIKYSTTGAGVQDRLSRPLLLRHAP